MQMNPWFYALPLLFVGAISAGIAIFLWPRRKVPGATPLLCIMLLDVLWSFGTGLKLISTSPQEVMFWALTGYTGNLFIPACAFAFVLEYLPIKEKLPRHYWAILLSEPLIVFLLMVTNRFHNFLGIRYTIDLVAQIKLLSIEFGSIIYFHLLFSFIATSLSIFILIRAYRGAAKYFRRQITVILIGFAAPFLAGIIDALVQNNLQPIEISPYTFIIAQAAFLIAAARYRFLDILPLGRGSVIDSLEEGVIVLDQKNRIIDLNSSARQIIGCLSESTLGTPIDTLRSNPDCETLLRTIQKISAASEATVTETGGNHGRPYEIKITPMKDQWGAQTGKLVSIRDISEQKSLQAALFSSEEKYRSLVERSGDGIVIVQNNQIRYGNRQLAVMLGYTVDELIGGSFTHFFSPEYQTEIAERHFKRLSGEIVGSRYESVMLHRNGSRIDVEMNAGLMQYEGQPASLIFIRNVTEQNIVKEELESSVSLMKSTLESTTDGILVVNAENIVIRYNQRFEEIWQLPMGWQHMFDPDDILDYLASQTQEPDRFIKHVIEMMSQLERAGYDQLMLKDGRVIERYATPYQIEGNHVDNRIAGKVWNFRDVTERLEAEEALRRANEQLTATIRELEIHNREVTLLGEMGDLLHSCSTLEEAYSVVGDFSKRLFPNGSGALFVLNANRNRVEAVASFGDISETTMDFPPDYCWALRRGRVHTTNSSHSDLRCKHIPQNLLANRAYVCVPMIAQSETIGFLHVNGESSQNRLEHLAVTVAESIAMSIANIRLRETLRLQSIRDPLTGLYNRRYMESALDLEIRRALRYNRRVGILMIDIDRFKMFNDTYGHKMGDRLLEGFGSYLLSHSRSEDIICRYGGEEFILILPGAGAEDCLEKAELIRVGVQELPVDHNGDSLYFTVSIGLAVFPEEGITADIVVNAADQALYEAKNAGRNRVVAAKNSKTIGLETKPPKQLPG